jgi:O-antigen ligase
MTFGRIHWIMVMAGTLLLLILARRRLIIYPRITFLIVGASLVLTLILQLNVLNPAAIRDAIFKRTVSIVRAPSNFKEDTLYMRYLESRFAWQRIIEHPLLGIGLGNTYRPLVFGNVDYERFIRGTNVHNGYLATQLKMGILGTLAYSWLVLAFFYRFLHKWKRIEDPLYQTVALGVAMSVGGMLIANLTASPFLTVFWVSVTAVGMGVVEKIYQFEGIT